jgi:hypothetical protein
MAKKKDLAKISDLERGLRFGHLLMSVNRHMSREAAVYAQALVALLLDKEIITPEEFETQMKAHRGRWRTIPR